MKKLILAITALFTLTVSANAMSYEQARQQALFLADKMAYELNLTESQYEAVYEINLDYLMSINTYDDLYGVYWRQRNLDLSYILLDWQYRAYCAANYFYRPLYWDAGYWHFRVYARYPHRSYFYFGRPTFWTVYRGGHSWRTNGGRSWYQGRNYRPHPDRHHNNGMRDRFDRGDYKNHHNGKDARPNNRDFGSNRNNRNNDNGRFGSNRNNHNNDNGRFGNNRNNQNTVGASNDTYRRNDRENNTARPNTSFGRESSTRTTVGNSNNRFGNSRNDNVRERPTYHNRPSSTTPSNNNRSSFGSNSHSSNNRSFGSSSSGSRNSFGGSSSGSRSSFGNSSSGNRSSHASGGSRSGGGHFGGRR